METLNVNQFLPVTLSTNSRCMCLAFLFRFQEIPGSYLTPTTGLS